MSDEWTRHVTYPDGRDVVFDEDSRAHLSVRRPGLLQYVDVILDAIARPDHRTADPEAGRERFYRQSILDRRRCLRVVVDFNKAPGRIVTALVQTSDPRRKR